MIYIVYKSYTLFNIVTFLLVFVCAYNFVTFYVGCSECFSLIFCSFPRKNCFPVMFMIISFTSVYHVTIQKNFSTNLTISLPLTGMLYEVNELNN